MAEARIAQLRAWIAELDTAIAEHIAALVTSRHNPVFSTAYKRLIAAGKPPKVALGALMRKFLVTLNAIFKTQQPWSPTPTPAQT